MPLHELDQHRRHRVPPRDEVALDGGLRNLASPRPGMLVVRGLSMLAAYTSYYLGLAALPIAKSVAAVI